MNKLLPLLPLLLSTFLSGQSHRSYPYHDSLQLDLYEAVGPDEHPLLIYVHGGGFSGGARSEGAELCTELQRQGISCATISYTLSMRGRTEAWGCRGILSEKLRTLQLVANEVWAATGFLMESDSSRPIFLAGSSAGAEAVLHAAFYDRENMALFDHGLAPSFRYAGVISGAGALLDPNLITAQSSVPLLLLHGTEDPLVPYGTAPHHFCDPADSGWLMLFGAGALADRTEAVGGSFTLLTHPGAGHEIAGRYFHGEYERVTGFIQRCLGPGSFRGREWIGGERPGGGRPRPTKSQ